MMPLTLAQVGEANIIRRIGGTPQVKQHLADLGLTVGSEATIVAQVNDNLIVRVKDTRIGLDQSLAQKIFV